MTKTKALPLSGMIAKTLFALVIFCFAMPIYGQTENTISLRLEKVTLVEFFRAVEKNSNLRFSYIDENIDNQKDVSVNTSNENVELVIQRVLNSKGYTYKRTGNTIAVLKTSKSEITPSKKITGLVTDEKGDPIIGASVVVRGSDTGTITNIDGIFTLEVQNQSLLTVSYIGYIREQVRVGTANQYRIVLIEDTKLLEEVVVVGYGVQNRRDISTSISQVKGDQLVDIPVSDFRQGMVGKMTGVQVLQTSGDPEGAVRIRVRGISSATAGNEPLYIVDGIPVERGFANMNNNDIESVEVLKDASSAAIYGSRGSNGVIIITTKQGKSEKLSVKYDALFGTQNISKKLPLMNAYQFAEAARDGHTNSYLDEVPTGSANDPNSVRPQSYHRIPPELFPYLLGETGLVDTDWQDEIFRTAQTTSHNLSLSGKGKNIRYFVSGNYMLNEGIVIESDFEKIGLRLNLDGNYDKFKFGVNFAPSYSKSNRVDASGPYTGGGIVQSALAMPPVWPVYNPDGTYNFQGNGYWRIGNDYQHNEILNPVALAKLQSDVVDRYATVGKIYGEYEIIKGLTFNTSIGGDFYGSHNDTYRSSELPLIGRAFYDKPSNPVGYSSSSFYFNWLIENKLNYNTNIGDKHNINAILVQSAQKETFKSNNVTATDYPNDYIQSITAGTVTTGNSNIEEWALASYLARVQYSYEGKYMASAAIRADGSSRFGKNNRWGYFPSASAAWRISDEPFLVNTKSFLDDLKLRASYGVTGNFQIGNYEHLPTMAFDNYILGTGDGNLFTGYSPDKPKNDDLSWEKTRMVNVGVDVQLFKGLLGVTLELYNSNTTDMLLNVPIPHTAGQSTARMNIGKVNNKGIEILLTSTKNITADLKYNASANFSKNINEVKALGPGNTPIIATGGVNHAYYITQVGSPIGSYYLLVKDGVFMNADELKLYPHFANTRPGDFRFVDVDKDGILDVDKDRMIVGNYMPDFTYGFNGTLSYKNLDLGVVLQGVYGNEILNLNRRYIDNIEGNTNGTIIGLDRWISPEQPGNGQVNRSNRKQTGFNTRTSTWHIEDGSYLRLQNVTLGYTLPKNLTRRLAMEKLRVYMSGQNLFTWTNYTGYNPEVNIRPTNALTPGEDYGTYPLARVLTLGLNISF
jgi:TonB-linked SusC/RagA family outer membrane protein